MSQDRRGGFRESVFKLSHEAVGSREKEMLTSCQPNFKIFFEKWGVGGQYPPKKKNKNKMPINQMILGKFFFSRKVLQFFLIFFIISSMKITKKKIIEILVTALISAGIAFLQNLLSNLVGTPELKISPETTGMIGGAIHAVRSFRIG